MFERYRIYNCCVFIDFEYISVVLKMFVSMTTANVLWSEVATLTDAFLMYQYLAQVAGIL